MFLDLQYLVNSGKNCRKRRTCVRMSRDAAALFVGTHDFTQFANLSPSNEYRHPVKTLTRCDVVDLPDGFRIEVKFVLWQFFALCT